MKRKVLIADDDKSLLWVLERFFRDKRFKPLCATDGNEAQNILKTERVELVLMDINMPGKTGLQILKELKGLKDLPPVIIMTAEATMENTIAAMKHGALDYVSKPVDLDELDIIVGRAMENARLRKELSTLKKTLEQKWASETVFVGKSKAAERIFKTIGRIAPRNVTVLIQGESGTGKEIVAKLVHLNSPRREGPFVAVNSAAVPRELMESELFGHEKGAFTGATETRKGRFELADGGTIFLDEIGDMDVGLQAKLLRVLQEKEFYRIGGKEPIRVDVRIIAATNQNLEKCVEEGRFREDLYYRLNVVGINIPPLRERKEDIEPLSEYFLERFVEEMGVERRMLSREALAALRSHNWPGNVRELENVLRRAVLLSSGVVITPEDLALKGKREKKESLEAIIERRLAPFIDKTGTRGKQHLYADILPLLERPLIRLVLKKTRFNQLRAAELLGINRNTLRKKIKELNITRKDLSD